MSVRITLRQVADVTILDMSGRITLGEGALDFRETVKGLMVAGKKKILLNFGDVSYIDSSGIGELVSAFTTVTNRGGALKVMALTGRTRDFMQITKLASCFEMYGGEKGALRSFEPGLSLRYCLCPVCGRTGEPAAEDDGGWDPQTCHSCYSRFTVRPIAGVAAEIQVTSVRVESYLGEYFDVLDGPPFTVQVVGRLNLFTRYALNKAWKALPTPRRAIFDLRQAVEIDEEGRDTLLALLSSRDKVDKAVVSLEGLSREQANLFPSVPPFYAGEKAALAALGDVSDAPQWRVEVEERRNAF